jgi:outer membrane protein assembly factor BamD
MTQSARFISALLPLLAVALAITGASTRMKDRPYVARDVDTLYTAAQSTLAEAPVQTRRGSVRRGRAPASLFGLGAPRQSALRYYVGEEELFGGDPCRRKRFIAPPRQPRGTACLLRVVAVSCEQIQRGRSRPEDDAPKALDALRELIRRFTRRPEYYAADARLKVDLTRDHLAGKEMEIKHLNKLEAIPRRGRPVPDRHPRQLQRRAIPRSSRRLVGVLSPRARPARGEKAAATRFSAILSEDLNGYKHSWPR